MTHQFIPSLPTPKAVQSSATPKPPGKHRAILPTVISHEVAAGLADLPSSAVCVGSVPYCGTSCPMHWPNSYPRVAASHRA